MHTSSCRRLQLYNIPQEHSCSTLAHMQERGCTLQEWTKQRRNYGEVLSMVENVARLLAVLHESGRVHRDLKPDNVLYLLQSTKWCLLDLGIVAPAGAESLVHCCMAGTRRAQRPCALNAVSARMMYTYMLPGSRIRACPWASNTASGLDVMLQRPRNQGLRLRTA